jgi:UDP-GlcNAc:undecaprenyl-phosphate/decaprenyl-phosphate GlcNAc-1-phosphate transferase
VHPSLEYALVCCLAAAGSFLLTPIVRYVAVRWGAVAAPRDRDVHAVAIPRMGGVAMLGGLLIAMIVARQMPTLRAAFGSGPNFRWILVSAALICLIGVLDDRYELDSLTKLAGQVLATGVMVTLGGVQLTAIYIPWGDTGTLSLGSDLGIPATILLTVLTINAVNFVDGLDGLAAGVAAISSIAFFAFCYHLASANFVEIWAAPTLLTAALAGACLGFLPHNFWPARIFMGDSGSMLIGLLLSAAAITATSYTDPQGLDGLLGSLPLALPLLPLAVLAVPLIDLLFAVIRRVRHGRSPFSPDKQHLHHRLLEIGHTHRRAVLLLYFWSALLAFGGVAFSVAPGPGAVVVVLSALAVVGLVISAVPRFRHSRPAASALPATATPPLTSRPPEPPIPAHTGARTSHRV